MFVIVLLWLGCMQVANYIHATRRYPNRLAIIKKLGDALGGIYGREYYLYWEWAL